MPRVIALRPSMPVPAVASTDRLLSAKAGAKQRICEYVVGLATRAGLESAGAGVGLFEAAWRAQALPAEVLAAVQVVRPAADAPNRATLYRWLAQYQAAQTAGSLAPLEPQHRGRQRADWGWEVRALHLWQQPSKPAASEVARQLREEGQASATEPRVRRYLASLPSTVLERGRLGPRLRRAKGDYVARTTEGMAAGLCYVGDGHTIDVYLCHPTGRRPFRAELTVWLDWRSRCVAGWWLSESESGLTTLFSLSHAIRTHDHVPPMIHVDNGSGFKAQIHTDEAIGFLARWGITSMFALPYNARSKIVERFFGTLEGSFGKRWPSYCGDDMDEEARAAILKRFKKDPAALPSVEQYKEALAGWLDGYHREEHPEIKGKSRAQVWAEELKANPPGPGAGLWWPRVERTVNRRRVELDGRFYRHSALDAFNKTDLRDGKVWVEYDVHDDATVRVLTKEGRWICDAELAHKKPAIPASRVVEAELKSERAKVKRLESHIQEVHDRAALVTDAGQSLRAIEDATGEVSRLAEELARGAIGGPRAAPTDEPELDIWQ
jgi:putative transposase